MKKIISVSISFVVISFYLFAQQTSSKPTADEGKKLYEQYCLTCHQADGTGVPKLNPPLEGSETVKGDKKKLITWVLQGTTDKKEINGEYYNNNMPSQSYLKDQEIADVLTYIRNSFGNKASAVTATDVKNVRATVK